MIPLIGYSDRLSVAPGERIEFKVSSALDKPYEAGLVRIRCGDPNPDGPGIKEQSLDAAFSGSYPSRFQPIFCGSYARVAEHSSLTLSGSFTLSARIWPTLPGKTAQGLIAKWDNERAAGFALLIDEHGTTLRLGDGKGRQIDIPVGKSLRPRVWYQVWASWDAASHSVSVGQRPLVAAYSIDDEGVIEGTFSNGTRQVLGQVALATFINPEGLEAKSGNLFAVGANSGDPTIGPPRTGAAGRIQAGALELSNVDLSREFINLIEASTGVSAASRVIRTADQLLQELLLLVR